MHGHASALTILSSNRRSFADHGALIRTPVQSIRRPFRAPEARSGCPVRAGHFVAEVRTLDGSGCRPSGAQGPSRAPKKKRLPSREGGEASRKPTTNSRANRSVGPAHRAAAIQMACASSIEQPQGEPCTPRPGQRKTAPTTSAGRPSPLREETQSQSPSPRPRPRLSTTRTSFASRLARRRLALRLRLTLGRLARHDRFPSMESEQPQRLLAARA